MKAKKKKKATKKKQKEQKRGFCPYFKHETSCVWCRFNPVDTDRDGCCTFPIIVIPR